MERIKLVDCPKAVMDQTLDAAFRIHRYFGPGLLESVYELALQDDLQSNGLSVRRQIPIPVYYKDKSLGSGFRADLVVEDCLLIEVKSSETILDVHLAQVLTYLRLSNIKRGFLLNFNVRLMKDGIKRIAI